MVPCLLQGRVQLDDAALPLDEAYGIRFNSETFHFAACACLVRASPTPVTKATGHAGLSTFLQMTTWNPDPEREQTVEDLAASPYMALMGHSRVPPTSRSSATASGRPASTPAGWWTSEA